MDDNVADCRLPSYARGLVDPALLCDQDSPKLVFGEDGLLVYTYQCVYYVNRDLELIRLRPRRQRTIEVRTSKGFLHQK